MSKKQETKKADKGKVVKLDKQMDGDEFLKRIFQVKKEDLKKK